MHFDNQQWFRVWSKHVMRNNETEVVFCSSEILVYQNLACLMIIGMVSAHVYIEIHKLLTALPAVHIQVEQRDSSQIKATISLISLGKWAFVDSSYV